METLVAPAKQLNKKPTNWWRRQNSSLLKFDPKPSEAAFLNFDICRTEVADDVISGVAVDWVVVDVLAKFGDSRLSNGRIIRLLCRPDPL